MLRGERSYTQSMGNAAHGGIPPYGGQSDQDVALPLVVSAVTQGWLRPVWVLAQPLETCSA